MRTKTLLLTAALTAAGVATSMAQVYSVNMVGYINLPIPAGYSIIANQLNGTPDNQVVNLIPAPPEETTFYKYNGAGFDVLEYFGGAYSGATAMTLNPGESAYIAASAAFTATFVGEVQLASSLSINPGYQMISSVLPQSLPVDGNPNDGNPAAPAGLGYPVAEEDTIYRYNNAASGFDVYEYFGGAWNPAPPTPNIGEGFWVGRLGAASNWIRNFVVGVD
jgi:hypothetical protein